MEGIMVCAKELGKWVQFIRKINVGFVGVWGLISYSWGNDENFSDSYL